MTERERKFLDSLPALDKAYKELKPGFGEALVRQPDGTYIKMPCAQAFDLMRKKYETT